MAAINKLGDIIFNTLKICLLVILTGMILGGFLAVISRFALKIPLPWAEELLRFLFVWMTLLGSAVAFRTKGHICMEILVERLPAKIQLAISTVVTLLCVSFFGYLTVSGYQMSMMNAGQISDSLGISMVIPYLAIPIGSVLMIFFIVELFFDEFRKMNVQGGE